MTQKKVPFLSKNGSENESKIGPFFGQKWEFLSFAPRWALFLKKNHKNRSSKSEGEKFHFLAKKWSKNWLIFWPIFWQKRDLFLSHFVILFFWQNIRLYPRNLGPKKGSKKVIFYPFFWSDFWSKNESKNGSKMGQKPVFQKCTL